MAEYIEKQAATTIPVLPKAHRHYQTMNLDDAYEDGWFDALECVEKIPPADVRPVVLCGDCRWFDVTGFSDKDLYMPELRMGHCLSLGRDVQACWYCATGEQKEEACWFRGFGEQKEDANSLTEAIKRNTAKIEEKENDIRAEYIRHLQEKNKALDEELASLRETFLQATRGGRVDDDEKD